MQHRVPLNLVRRNWPCSSSDNFRCLHYGGAYWGVLLCAWEALCNCFMFSVSKFFRCQIILYPVGVSSVRDSGRDSVGTPVLTRCRWVHLQAGSCLYSRWCQSWMQGLMQQACTRNGIAERYLASLVGWYVTYDSGYWVIVRLAWPRPWQVRFGCLRGTVCGNVVLWRVGCRQRRCTCCYFGGQVVILPLRNKTPQAVRGCFLFF